VLFSHDLSSKSCIGRDDGVTLALHMQELRTMCKWLANKIHTYIHLTYHNSVEEPHYTWHHQQKWV